MATPSNLHIQLKLSRAEKYPAKQHIRRVAKELHIASGLIYLLGQYDLPAEDSDSANPWRQRRYFYYCSGVDFPNACLTYDIAGDCLVLYIPEIHPERVIWEGRPPTIREAEAAYDVDSVRHNSELFSDMKRWSRQYGESTLFILHKDHIPEIDFKVKIDSEQLISSMDRCRAIKDDYEVARIKKANEVSASAHRAVLRNLKKFQNEAEIHGKFVDVSISNYAKQAYHPIAGSGQNAGVLHYNKNNEPLAGRQLVCLDAGAEFENYASDVTRTFPISGYMTKEAEDIYGIVEMMQESCIEMLKPGVKLIDLHNHCHKLVAEQFLKFGIFQNGTADEIVEARTTRGFYPHGLGHHLGLDTHDIFRSPPLRYSETHRSLFQSAVSGALSSEQPELRQGMVITIEPGIYFNRYELERAYLSSPVHSKYINADVLDKYWSVGGVRIEDDILITDKGYENLTTAPKGEEALALIRAGNECLNDGDDEN